MKGRMRDWKKNKKVEEFGESIKNEKRTLEQKKIT
jgi:hypothetical protein